MNATRRIWTFLFLILVATVFRLSAQQTEADHKLFEETKAKAEKGDVMAQYSLGFSYANGQGVAKDEVEAAKWFRKVADQNIPEAQYGMGVCYTKGSGVAKDAVEAGMWFRKAAERNLAVAQYNLGVCCLNGEGVTKNYLEAYKWIFLAAAQGNQQAKEALAMLEKAMPQEQIDAGQKLASNFKPRKTAESLTPVSGIEAASAESSQKPAAPKAVDKNAEPVGSIESDARKLYSEVDEFVNQLVAKIDAIDKTHHQKEGEGFLHGFKEVSADGGKSYILINEHTMKVSGGRNGARRALSDYDALTHVPTAHDRAKLATDFMFNTDMFFLTAETPTRGLILAQRVAKQTESADEMERKYENLKKRSLSMRLRMYSLITDYLEGSK